VKKVGPGVTVAEPGDPVLLSFSFCNECVLCKANHHSHCPRSTDLNFGGPYPTFSQASSPELNISGLFFGQSSFASLSIVRQCSVVNVKQHVQSKHELQLFAPLGCGIQTGSGTVINCAKAGPDDTVLVMGLGGVGLSAIMGARVQGCRQIIGLDRIASRLEFARKMGATHVIDGSKLGDKSLVDAVRDITQDRAGPTVTIDTTGVPTLVKAGVEVTRNRGKYVQVGTNPFDFKLEIPMFEFMMSGKQIMGAIEGQAFPPEYVPKMIQWYREGRFPFDKLVKLMPADQFEEALKEMHDGTTIKPILCW